MEYAYPPIEKLLAYVQGELSVSEVAALEKMMAEDPGLVADIEELRLLAKAQGENAASRLKTHADNVVAAIPRRRSFSWYSIAASIAVLLSIGLWLFLSKENQTYNPREILAWNEVSGQRNGNNESERWKQILSLGIKGDFSQTVDSLRSWIAAYPEDGAAQVFLGRALALSGKQQEAETVLLTVEQNEGFLPQTRLDAKWYRAMVLMQENRASEGCQVLQEILTQLGKKRRDIGANLIESICEG